MSDTPVVITTLHLLRLVQLGMDSDDQRILAAADTVASFLVLHLRRRAVCLPSELVSRVDLLQQLATDLRTPQTAA